MPPFKSIPLNDRFSLQGRVGVLFSELKYSECGTESTGDAFSFNAPNDRRGNLSFGLGASYVLGGPWSLRADWDRFRRLGRSFALTEEGNGRFDNVDLFTLNLQYTLR